MRTRVFTTSLGGQEDVATGGVGALFASEDHTGRIEVLQGRDGQGIRCCHWVARADGVPVGLTVAGVVREGQVTALYDIGALPDGPTPTQPSSGSSRPLTPPATGPRRAG